MLTTVGLGITVALSILIFALLSVYSSGVIAKIKNWIKKKRGKKTEETHKITFVTSFHKFLLSVFIAGMILFIPFYWTEFSGDFWLFRSLKTLLLSIHNMVRLFILDGDFEPIQAIIAQAQAGDSKELFKVVRYTYTTYAAAMYLIAPFLTAGFVLSLFKGVTEYMKYQFLYSADEVYLISELNERSIELAKDILDEERIARQAEKEKNEQKNKEGKKRKDARNRKRIIVFAEVFDQSEERSFELISQAKSLGAFCFKRDIVDIGLKRKKINKDTEQKLYFIGENEDENVEQALLMIEECRKNEKFNTPNTQFYVFSTTVESEVLIDSVDNGEMTVRRINENKNLVYATLREPAVTKEPSDDFIFKHAIKEENLYKLRILIVGLGNYGIELLKTLCWSCQIPRHELEIYVFDKEKNARDRIARLAPDLIAHNGIREAGNPYYKIVFGSEEIIQDEYGERVVDNGMDVRTRGFFQRLDAISTGPITTAFITLGEDELNIETAMGLRTYFGQKAQQEGLSESYKKMPNIYPVVYSPAKNRICANGLESYDHRSFGITFIGNMEKRYSLDAIEQTDLSAKGEEVHLSYGGLNDLKKAKAFVAELNKIGATGDPVVIKNFLMEKKQKIDAKLSAWAKALEKFRVDLGQDKEITKEFLELHLTLIKNKLTDEPLNEWLQEEKTTYESYVELIDEKTAHTAASADIENKLLLYESTKELKYFTNCLNARNEEAAALVKKLEKKVEESRKDYYRYEYPRSSSMATAMHKEIKDRAYELCIKREGGEIQGWASEADPCEHKRWMAYMWSEGYRKGKFKSPIAKTHSRLVSVEERSWLDQVKTVGIVGGTADFPKEQ